jgi:hypothetical protein
MEQFKKYFNLDTKTILIVLSIVTPLNILTITHPSKNYSWEDTSLAFTTFWILDSIINQIITKLSEKKLILNILRLLSPILLFSLVMLFSSLFSGYYKTGIYAYTAFIIIFRIYNILTSQEKEVTLNN